MIGSASGLEAPSSSKSSIESQLATAAPSSVKTMRSMARDSSWMDASRRFWNTSRATRAGSAPAATISEAATREAASVFWYWKRPVSVTSPV